MRRITITINFFSAVAAARGPPVKKQKTVFSRKFYPPVHLSTAHPPSQTQFTAFFNNFRCNKQNTRFVCIKERILVFPRQLWYYTKRHNQYVSAQGISMRHRKSHIIILGGIAFAFAIMLSGCGGFFATKNTDIESRLIIDDISRIKENPHVNNTLPEVYTKPAQRLEVADGVKLFYFTKHHSAAELGNNLRQLGLKMDKSGKKVLVPGLNVSQNISTNQLIIHCKNHAEADKVEEYLAGVDVPPIQVNIDCLIIERFGDVTTDWETTLLIENLLGEGLTLGEDKFPDPAFPGAALREERRGTFGLDFGYWMDKGVSGHQVRAIVDLLESRGYLKILMNPTLETINGKKATVLIRDFAPVSKTITTKNVDDAYTLTEFKWVEDTLTVTPHVYADGYIGLTTSIRVGSKSKPEGVVQTPILTERSINIAENRIEPGRSLVIGGMRKAENRSVVRGIPLLKDIPLIGVLFSSKDFEEKATEITFILTPTISSSGTSHPEMVEFISEKYSAPKHEAGVVELITNPLGDKNEKANLIEKATKAQIEHAKAKTRKADAENKMLAEKARKEKAISELKAAKAVIDTAASDTIKAKKTIEAAQKQAKIEEAQIIKAAAKKAAAEKAAAEKAAAEKAAAEKAAAEKAAAEKAAAEKAAAEKTEQQAD